MSYYDFLDSLYPQWHARASCNGMEPDRWFPSAAGLGNNTRREDVTRDAIKICKSCPVRRECAADRDRHQEQWGIWAGVDLEAKDNADAA